MQPLFVYQERLLPNQIRVLLLEPTSDVDSDIQCSLLIADRAQSSDYTALSYSWGMNQDGDTTPCRNIYIADKCMPITRNLYEGLRRLRDPYQHQRLWVDAVCINQQDIAERNTQVAAMADVYACATRVVVWLGEGDTMEQDAAAFTLLKYLSSRNDLNAHTYNSKFFVSGSEVDIAAVHQWAAEDVSKKFKAARLRQDSRLQQSISVIAEVTDALLGRRWFSRRWIVQEVVIPHNDSIKVHWGCYSLPFGKIIGNQIHGLFKNEFRKTFDLLPTTSMSESQLKNHRHMDFMLSRVRRLSQRCTNLARMQLEIEPQASRLTDALWIYSRQDCSDPRDRIYALLSLAQNSAIVPDYGITTAELFVRFARDLVARGLLGMLFSSFRALKAQDPLLGEAEIELPALHLPSWVPDLRLPFSGGNLGFRDILASVDENNILSCQMSYLGHINDSPAGLEVASSSGANASFLLPPDSCHLILPGDIACLAGVSNEGRIVVLRNGIDPGPQRHQLIRTLGILEIAEFQYGRQIPQVAPPSMYYIV